MTPEKGGGESVEDHDSDMDIDNKDYVPQPEGQRDCVVRAIQVVNPKRSLL